MRMRLDAARPLDHVVPMTFQASQDAPSPDPAAQPCFIGSEIYRTSRYGARHPLSIPRVSTVIDLSRALGWLPDDIYIDSPRATPQELARYHDPDYVAAVQRAEAEQSLDEESRQRYHLGLNGNPIFPEIFSRPATACGGSLLAARLLEKGGIVYNPAGGTHHGQPGRASGFCYFNDPALGILGLLDQGVTRIFYLDLDAHHGDGVQQAFAGDPRVFTLSLHEAGRWPMTQDGVGSLEDTAGGTALNLPLPQGANDSEFEFLIDTVVLPLIDRFAPEALVVQGGADALEEDPLSRLSLSNQALWRAVAAVQPLAPRLLMLGGGGYNPWSVARCWTGIWGLLSGQALPERLPPDAEAILRALSWRHSRGRHPPEHWFTQLADAPRGGPIRANLRDLARRALEIAAPLCLESAGS